MIDLGELFLDLGTGALIKWYHNKTYHKEDVLSAFIDTAVKHDKWSVVIITMDNGELLDKYKVICDNGVYSVYILTDAGFIPKWQDGDKDLIEIVNDLSKK